MTQVIDRTGFTSDKFAQSDAVPLADYAGDGALLLGVEDDPSEVAAHFATLDLVVIPFEKFADGRGFSLAGMLRGLGYVGHLRARGHILVDQFRAAIRCGFDDVEISDAQAARNPEHQWQAVPLGQSYQSHITDRTDAHERARKIA